MTAHALLSIVGEVAIIMIGILLALAVDRWKEDRADRRLEVGYLQSLARDLRHDSEMLTAFCGEVGDALDAADSVLSVLRGEREPEPDVIAGELIRAANGNEPVYAVATYTELSGGNLRLIRNADLKADLVEYYSALLTGERVRSRVTPQLWYDAGVEPYLLELWKVLPAGDWLTWFAGGSADIDVAEVVSGLQAVPRVEEYLEGCRRCRRLQLEKFAFHQEQATVLLRAVQAEIDRRSS